MRRVPSPATMQFRRALTATAMIFAVLIPLAPAAVASSPENATAAEQWFLYDLNQARWNPQAYADRVPGYEDQYDTSFPLTYLDMATPLPPLAPNDQLFASSGYKANLTANAGFYADTHAVGSFNADWQSQWYHCSYQDGGRTWRCPNRLISDYGYPVGSNWNLDNNYVEAYWASNGTGELPPAAVFLGSYVHTQFLFTYTGYYEGGVGHDDECPPTIITGTPPCRFLFVHTAWPTPIQTFVTGAVFDDTNHNDYMDLGEGLPGVTVSIPGHTPVTTGPGGLYSIPVGNGTYQVTASGAGFPATVATVPVDGYNAEADFITDSSGARFGSDGSTTVVHSYGLCNGLAPTKLGTEGDDVINGTGGDDVIYAGGGDDVIDGRGGNDTICGGAGKDLIEGGSGDDTILGGGSRDVIKGQSGNDTILGNGGRDRIFGGSGDDMLEADKGKDRVHGGDGSDVLKGNGGGDTLKGDDGNDTLKGGGGSNILDGGPGYDACKDGTSYTGCEA